MFWQLCQFIRSTHNRLLLSNYNQLIHTVNKKPLTSKRERTRQAIINAAICSIADKGLPSTSIDELMRHTGMARGTFYNYFQTREQLLTAVIEHLRDLIHLHIEQQMPKDLPTDAVVACIIYGFICYSLAQPTVGWTLVRLSTDTDFFQLPNQDDHRFQRINTALMKGIKRDIPFLAAQIYTIGSVNTLLSHVLQKHITLVQAEQMMALILRGIGIEETKIDTVINTARDFAETVYQNSVDE